MGFGNIKARELIYEAHTQLGRCRIRVRRSCPRVGAASELFFFLGFAMTRLDSRWTGHILAIIGPYWVVSAGDRNGQNMLKSALNHAGTVEIGFEWCPNILNLSILNFIMNIYCFFCVVFFFLFLFVCLFCVSSSLHPCFIGAHTYWHFLFADFQIVSC